MCVNIRRHVHVHSLVPRPSFPFACVFNFDDLFMLVFTKFVKIKNTCKVNGKLKATCTCMHLYGYLTAKLLDNAQL